MTEKETSTEKTVEVGYRTLERKPAEVTPAAPTGKNLSGHIQPIGAGLLRREPDASEADLRARGGRTLYNALLATATEACPEPERLVPVAQWLLSDEAESAAVAPLRRHVAECAACASVVAGLVRGLR
jgi:hypothetical protein